MSGGVDSSLAAAVLTEAGESCTGITMALGRGASDESAIGDARAVCEHLGIPHRIVDLSAEFRRCVVESTVTAYASGTTPNPCVMCNTSVKFGALLDLARADGSVLATGHYARIVDTPEGLRLARARDPRKDQSYFLYRLRGGDLGDIVFPLGDLIKTAVRAMAAERGLSEKHGSESQDACFLGEGGYPALVAAILPDADRPGPILDVDGSRVGTHAGLSRYTVGQRRGIGVASVEPLYVLALDASRNAIVVGPRQRLGVRAVVASEAVWHGPAGEARADVMVRYNARPVGATVRLSGARLHVVLDTPVEGVAPGQALVCYNGDVVIGGGTIEEAS